MKSKSILLIVAVFNMSSCGDLRKTRPRASFSVIKGLESQTTKFFLASEIVIGKRICESLKKKKAFLDTFVKDNGEEGKKRLRFYAEVRECKSTEIFNKNEFNVKPKLIGTDYEYVSDNRASSEYISEVISHENGHMEVFCNRFNKENAIKMENFYTNGRATITASFSVIDSYDQLKIIKKVEDVVTESESIMFITQDVTENAKYFGIEKDRSQYILCPDNRNTFYIKQTWKEEIILP